MRTLIIALLVLFTAAALPAAHAGPSGKAHSHATNIDEAEARVDAAAVVDRLVAKEKLDPSWKGLKADQAAKKTYEKGPEWVVTFQNPAAEEGKRTLYVFLTLKGDYVAANFTGK